MNKRFFYCWYLGFTEVNGLIGQQYVVDGIQRLTAQSNLFNKNQNDAKRKKIASKVTISLNDKSFTLIGNSSTSKNPIYNFDHTAIKTYTIEYENISYITRLNDPKYSDIVSLIIVNSDDQSFDDFYPRKQQQQQQQQHPYRHVAKLHAFKFDSSDSAKRLEKYFNECYYNYRQNIPKVVPIANNINYNKNINIKNVINTSNNKNVTSSNKSLNSGGTTTTGSSSNDSDYDAINKNNIKNINNEFLSRQKSFLRNQETSQAKIAIPKPFEDINNEFKRKLFSEQPLLLPPKDYNTVMRSRGDLEKAENRRSLNQQIVGKTAIDNRQQLEKIDENRQYVLLPSPRNKEVLSDNDDDDMSIDEEAKKVLNYYDAVVNSIANQSPINLNNNSNHYRFEPPGSLNSNNGQLTKISTPIETKTPPSSISPIINQENFKMNPLHVIDEDYPDDNINQFKLLKPTSNGLFLKLTPATIPPSGGQSTQMAFQGGFRNSALMKLGNYAPKAIPQPPDYRSVENLQNSYYFEKNQNNNKFNSSLPADQFLRLHLQKPSTKSSNVAANPTFTEPEIDYYDTDTLDLHRKSNNNKIFKDSQFILTTNQVHQQPLFSKLNHSTPNISNSYQQYYNMKREVYPDVYY